MTFCQDFNANTIEGVTLIFSVKNGKCGVKGISNKSYSGHITIPTIANGYVVTSIFNSAFYCSSVTSFGIPESVTTIGDYAFLECSELNSIFIPKSVISIGNSAFRLCPSLSTIVVDSDNPIYDSRDNCNAIIESSTNTLITGCVNTIIPKNIVSIGISAFSGCSLLKSIILSDNIIYIESNAFSDCSSLTSIQLPVNLKAIGDGMFQNCSSLVSIVLPESVTSIGSYAFEGCSSLTDIKLPNSTLSIYDSAFKNCSNLFHITFPDNWSYLSSSVFNETAWFNNQPDGVVYAGNSVYKYKGIMPQNTTISLKEGITGITDWAFADCVGLSNISIPNSVSFIGTSAFDNCSSLSAISLPKKLAYLGWQAFRNCTSLQSITFASGVTYMGYNAFQNTKWLKNQADGVVYAGNWAYTFKGEMSSNTKITLKAGTRGIADYAFEWQTGLNSITVPSSITFIGNSSFSYCKFLTSVNIPDDAKVGIGSFAFENCTSLTTINIPNSMETLCGGVFSGCSALKTITIPNSITLIDAAVFINCSSLTSVIIPDGVTAIGANAFNGCSSLTSISIPNSVTSIGYGAFEKCYSLTSITIPSSIMTIGDIAFRYCDMLTSIRSHIPNPFPVKDVFQDDITLFVPIGKTEAYKSTSGWPSNIQELTALTPIIDVYDSEVHITSEDAFSEIYYTLDGSTPCRNSLRYKTPFIVTPSLFNIKAIAVGDDMHDSPINQITKGDCCSEPIVKTGTFGIELFSDDNATIYYTTDGSAPTIDSKIYTNAFKLDSPGVVRAIAMREGYNPSAISVTFTSCFNNDVLQVAKTGVVSEAIQIWGLEDVEQLSIKGSVNQDDIKSLKQLSSLKVLDLQQGSIDGGLLSDECFATFSFTTIWMPKNVTAGQRLFADCPYLAAIVWNGNQIPAKTLSGINNPNLLLYVEKEEDATNVHEDGIHNIIINGKAKSIILTDKINGNNNFYCPQPFTAEAITYTHDYQMQTGIHECKGWETIALPFDVETVTHETKGVLTTAVENAPTRPLYWLYEYNEDGFIPASSISANTPYIISMPNNPAYSNEYNLSGKVTFMANNVTVPTTDLHSATKGAITFCPCFERVTPSPYIFVMNKQGDDATIPAGSLFLPDKHEVRPFEAYATTDLEVKAIPIFEDRTNAMEEIKNERMNKLNDNGAVYDLSGRKIVHRIIQKDLYFKDKKQILIY